NDVSWNPIVACGNWDPTVCTINFLPRLHNGIGVPGFGHVISIRSRHTAECSRTRRRGSARFHEHPFLFFDVLFYLGIETLPPPSSLLEFALDFDTMASATAFFAPSYANAFPHGPSPSFFHRSAYFSFGLPRSAFPALRRSSPLHKEPGFVPKPVRAPGVAYATAATEKSIHDFTVKVGP
ncbi:hypothetical protein BHE74_00016533, partial [Ensete ventricosum]